MAEIVWQDPPAAKTNQPGMTAAFVAALRGRAGEWALYPKTLAHPSASVYKKKHPGTEWTVRRRADGRYDAYARWVGGVS